MHRNKNVNSLLILGQVIVHHNHNLLIWDAILVDNLVGMACISLKDRESVKLRTCTVKGEVACLEGVELILSKANVGYKRKQLSHPQVALDKVAL